MCIRRGAGGVGESLRGWSGWGGCQARADEVCAGADGGASGWESTSRSASTRGMRAVLLLVCTGCCCLKMCLPWEDQYRYPHLHHSPWPALSLISLFARLHSPCHCSSAHPFSRLSKVRRNNFPRPPSSFLESRLPRAVLGGGRRGAVALGHEMPGRLVLCGFGSGAVALSGSLWLLGWMAGWLVWFDGSIPSNFKTATRLAFWQKALSGLGGLEVVIGSGRACGMGGLWLWVRDAALTFRDASIYPGGVRIHPS
ncbi:hypothetical protein DFH27DRAFT_112993 [Peziza echinospora]|nr:hypothetical protein DFH27DRAFT_112993 [Peziza echinospora]